MWEWIDFVACICFTGYKDRQQAMIGELKRVGLLDKTHFFWDFPSPFTTKIASSVTRDAYHQRMFPVGFNNYRAIKTAAELKKKYILVIEDDIRFLKDLELLKTSLSQLPKDFDIAMLDKNFPTEEWKKYKTANKSSAKKNPTFTWNHFDKFHSSGCYILSINGMKKFIASYERDAMKRVLKNNDEYFHTAVFGRSKMYAAFPNIAIQSITGVSGSCSPLVGYWLNNEYQGGRQDMYNLDFPYITTQNFLEYLYVAADRGIQVGAVSLVKNGGNIYCGLPSFLAKGVQSTSFQAHFNDSTKGVRYGLSIIWGNGTIESNIKALQIAYRDNCPLLLSEDGFIRSYTTWVDQKSPEAQRVGYSIVLDSSAYYFDALRVSNLERYINDPSLIVTDAQCENARRLINRIVSNKISKYNHQPIYTPTIGRKGVRKVLVVDQSYGDFSIKRGMADDSTFDKMLKAAIRENPNADILVKTHPDTIAGKNGEKKGYYQDLKEHDNIYKVTFPINPYSLMELCDKVYVCSSQFGFEALMANKEVHVFGMPFYAGWGLTIDDQHLDRRTNKRTLEELFYIFYCLYTHWVNPEKGCETTIDAVIDKMIALRAEYQSSKNRSSGSARSNSPSVSSPSRNNRKLHVWYSKTAHNSTVSKKFGWKW